MDGKHSIKLYMYTQNSSNHKLVMRVGISQWHTGGVYIKRRQIRETLIIFITDQNSRQRATPNSCEASVPAKKNSFATFSI